MVYGISFIVIILNSGKNKNKKTYPSFTDNSNYDFL